MGEDLATELSSAEESVDLCFRQLECDPNNEQFRTNFQAACTRALELAGALHELWKKDETQTHLEDMCQDACALVMKARHALHATDP